MRSHGFGELVRGRVAATVWLALVLLSSDDSRADDAPVPSRSAAEIRGAALSAIEDAAEYLRTGRYGIGGTVVRTFDNISPNRDRIELALTKSVDLQFIDTELTQVVSFLSERYQIPIRPDESALSEIGIGLDTQINLVISGISLRDSLELIIEPLELDYVIQQDVLQITTREQAERNFETRVYDLRSLQDHYEPDEIAELIRSVVQPERWRRESLPFGLGGTPLETPTAAPVPDRGATAAATTAGPPPVLGAMCPITGALVVTHNQRTHREIAALLNELARFAAYDPNLNDQQAAAASPEALLDLERASRQIVRLSGVVTVLQQQLEEQQGALTHQADTAKAEVDSLKSEIDRWQELHRRKLSELEAAKAELRQLKPQDN